jgi:hypothetical protein
MSDELSMISDCMAMFVVGAARKPFHDFGPVYRRSMFRSMRVEESAGCCLTIPVEVFGIFSGLLIVVFFCAYIRNLDK